MKILDGETLRDMTSEELAVHQLNMQTIVAQVEQQQNKNNARASGLAKFEALGLTPAEIAALVGA